MDGTEYETGFQNWSTGQPGNWYSHWLRVSENCAYLVTDGRWNSNMHKALPLGLLDRPEQGQLGASSPLIYFLNAFTHLLREPGLGFFFLGPLASSSEFSSRILREGERMMSEECKMMFDGLGRLKTTPLSAICRLLLSTFFRVKRRERYGKKKKKTQS